MPATESPAPPSGGRGLLSFEEAAQYLGPGFSPRWVRERVYEGTIPALRLTQRCTRIEQSALDEFVEAERQRAGVS